MKKLMIAAAAVAMVGSVLAELPAPREAQVYEIRVAMVTTEPAIGDFYANYNPFVTNDVKNLVFRKVATKSYGGLAWGCDCDAIAGAWDYRIAANGQTNFFGSCIWDSNANPIWVAKKDEELGIQFINAIENYGNVCEMYWEFAPTGKECEGTAIVDSDKKGKLYGAGFGTLVNKGCHSYVASANGLFAGYLVPRPYSYNLANGWCFACGDIIGDAGCVESVAWEFCECAPFLDLTRTAAYGQWVIAYNAVYTATFSRTGQILDIDYFTDTVKAAIQSVQVVE